MIRKQPGFSCSGAESRLAISFDHLIGAGEQRRRDDEAKRLGSLKVDDQLELGRLHDGQVDRLDAGKDFARRSGSCPKTGHRALTAAGCCEFGADLGDCAGKRIPSASALLT